MSAKTQLHGVTNFLQAVYGPGTRLSALLAREGYGEPQLALLRDQYLDAFLQSFVTAIAERIAQYHDGDRKVFVLVRRFGLDGQPRATLEDLATLLDISPERARRMEASVLRRCRFGKNRDYWPQALRTIAGSMLVAAPEPAQQESGQDTAVGLPPGEVVTQEVLSEPPTNAVPGTDLATITVPDGLFDAVDQILHRTGPISPSLIAHILRGTRGPVVDALIGYYHLEQYAGSFRAIDHRRLTGLVSIARGGSPNIPAAADPRVPVAVTSEPSPEEMRQFVDSVRTTVGGCSYVMVAHILNGSQGPKTSALVDKFKPANYGALRGLGFKRVKTLVEAAEHDRRRNRMQGAWSASAGPALLARLTEYAAALPTVADIQGFLDLRAANATADTHATLDHWLRVNRGRATASWLCLEDEGATADALPAEIGAMCCQLAPMAARDGDPERKTRLSAAILCAVTIGMDHVGRIPAGADVEQLSAAFAALITSHDTIGVRDLWLQRLAVENAGRIDKAPDRLWRRLLFSR
jgi:hypothetical protein